MIEAAVDSFARNVIEFFRWRHLQVRLYGSLDNGLTQRMFGPLLRDRGDFEDLTLCVT